MAGTVHRQALRNQGFGTTGFLAVVATGVVAFGGLKQFVDHSQEQQQVFQLEQAATMKLLQADLATPRPSGAWQSSRTAENPVSLIEISLQPISGTTREGQQICRTYEVKGEASAPKVGHNNLRRVKACVPQ